MADDGRQVSGDVWGDPISEERQAQLRDLFERQKAWVAQPEETRGESVFKDMHLTGADVYWLAEAMGRDQYWEMTNLHLEGADLSEAQLKGAILFKAGLDGADLSGAQLKGAILFKAGLDGADLTEAELGGADLTEAELGGADLTGATFDKTSHLSGALLTGASLDQVTYDGVNLTVVDWSLVPVLGDELTARQRIGVPGKRKDRAQRLDEFTAAVRANRVLAVTLRSQGMNEDADRYAYRAQLLQRTVLRLRRRWGAAFGSWLLDLISGYGYQPIRSVFTYALVILTFAAAYFALTNFALTPFLPSHSSPLAWYEALVLSVSSFHGRGLFPTGLSLGDPVAISAAVEAIIGLLIEITFIATFTQRFFAR